MSADSGGAPLGLSTVAALSNSRLYVVHSRRADAISIFGPDGRFERRIASPTLFGNVLYLEAHRDTVHAFDAATRKHVVVLPDWRLRVLGELPAAPFQAVFMPRGRLVINAAVLTPERVGLPLHLLERDYSVRLSFGADQPLFRPDIAYGGLRELTAGDNALWTAAKTSYHLERWAPSGRKLLEVYNNLDWFRPWFHGHAFSRTESPRSLISDIRVDSRGLLWVLVAAPDSSWRAGLDTTSDNGESYVVPSDWGRVYDSFVDIYDAATGRLVLRQRVPQFLALILDDNNLLGYGRNAAGDRTLTVWSITRSGFD